MKKYCLVVFAVFMFFMLPVIASADEIDDPIFGEYGPGLLRGLTPAVLDGKIAYLGNITDGDLGSYAPISNPFKIRYDLGKSSKVAGVYLLAKGKAVFGIYFYDKDMKLLHESHINGTGDYGFQFDNVRYFEVDVRLIDSSCKLLELDLKQDKKIVPKPPTNLTVTPGDGQVTMQWDASTSKNVNYNVYIDGVFFRSVNDTKLTIDNLVNGKNYQFSVATINSQANESVWISDFGKPEVIPLPPDVPTNLTVTPGDGSLILSWKSNKSGKFNVYVDGKKVAETDRTSYSLTDLENDRSYSVQVSALNNAGESEKTAAVTGIPVIGKVPAVKFKYSLADMALAIAEWFASIWPVVAFSVAIPLSFIVSARIKQLFT
jgi:hypothetical protein